MSFLVDTGADISILPAKEGNRGNVTEFKLYAANKSVIDTYGERSLEIKLGFCRSFPRRFIVADVQYAIIGTDLVMTKICVINVTV